MRYFIRRRYKYFVIAIDKIGEFFVGIKRIFIRPKKFEKDKINTIILLVLDLIGDGILATPAIRTVRENFLKAKITVVVGPWNKEMFENNPNVDEIKIINSFWARSNNLSLWQEIKTFIAIYRQTKKENYDLGIDFRGEFLSILLLRKMGVKYKVGYGITGGGWLLDRRVNYEGDRFAKHVVERNLDLLRSLDLQISGNVNLSVYPSEENKKVVDKFLLEHGIAENSRIVLIHPGSKDQARRWNDERWAEVVTWLLKNKYKVILSGGPNDNFQFSIFPPRADHPQAGNFQVKNKVNFLGYSILDLAELAGRVDLLLCVNSAPLHIASARKIPTIVLFAGSYPQTYGPWQNDKSVVLFKNVDCFPCGKAVCENNICMRKISVQEVIGAIQDIKHT